MFRAFSKFHKHGCVGDALNEKHFEDLCGHLRNVLSAPVLRWYTRAIMWNEASKAFGVASLDELTDDIYLECLFTTHEYFRRHVSVRRRRLLKEGSGPQTLDDRHSATENYLGGRPEVSRYCHFDVFCEELRGLHGDLRLETACEKDFVLALQYTNNRMTNWNRCRRMSDAQCFGGPQAFPQRLDHETLTHVPSEFAIVAAEVAADKRGQPGWLQCSECDRWRRVDGPSAGIWDNSSFCDGVVRKAVDQLDVSRPSLMHRLRWVCTEKVAAEQARQAAQVRRRMRGGAGVEALVCEVSWADLEGVFLDQQVQNALNGKGCMREGEAFAQLCFLDFFLRFVLPGISVTLASDIEARRVDLWNSVRGPVFRCDFLAGSSCEELGDKVFENGASGAIFTALPHGHPLLVQCCANREHIFNAVLHSCSVGHSGGEAAGSGVCSVIGCGRLLCASHPNGRNATYRSLGARGAKKDSVLSGLCKHHWDRVTGQVKQNQAIRHSPSKERVKVDPLFALWTDEELAEDPSRDRGVSDAAGVSSRASVATLTLRFHDVLIPARTDVVYSLRDGDGQWRLETALRSSNAYPRNVLILPKDKVPLRVAKTRTHFREDLLRCMHACHKVLGNLVLFTCVVCKNRLVAFHPMHQPDIDLDVVKSYRNEVAEWFTEPPAQRQKLASFHTGRCKRCVDSLKKVEKDDALAGVATFSDKNMMNLLWGLPDVDNVDHVDRFLGTDEGALLKEMHDCFDNATVVEEMLVALLHMQVNVCHLRQGRRKQYSGFAAYRETLLPSH